MENFVDAILTGSDDFVLTSVADSQDSHLLAFAAEASRCSGQTVILSDFEKNVRRSSYSNAQD